MEKDKQIAADLAIRQGLDGLLPDCLPGSWEQLTQRLETGEAVAPIATDETLRNKLDTIVPVLAPGSWESLRSRMDDPETDEIIQHKLSTHEPVVPSSSWAVLAARLELIAARRVAISCYKFSEVCLLLTALFLCWHIYQPQRTAPATVVVASNDHIQGEEAFVADEGNSATYETEFRPRIAPVVSASTNQATQTTLGLVDTELVRPLPVWEQLLNLAPAFDLEPAIDAIAVLDYRLDLRPRTGPRPALQLPLLEEKPERTLYLRPFISPWDINQVVTPRQAVNDIVLERDDRISYGSSAGILLDVERRKHAMQYGLIYGKRSYIPTVLKEVERLPITPGPVEPRDTNYSRITFQTISIPVSFQREIIDNGRWRLAASAGLAANVNIWASFRKSPTFNQDVLDWTRQTVNRFEPRGGANEDLPFLDAKDLVYPEQGLLQGGSLLANTSLSFSFGLSLERRLNERLSIYVAPRFSRAIYYQKGSGAEPFNDRIHNNSIQFGTRFRLGEPD